MNRTSPEVPGGMVDPGRATRSSDPAEIEWGVGPAGRWLGVLGRYQGTIEVYPGYLAWLVTISTGELVYTVRRPFIRFGDAMDWIEEALRRLAAEGAPTGT